MQLRDIRDLDPIMESALTIIIDRGEATADEIMAWIQADENERYAPDLYAEYIAPGIDALSDRIQGHD